MSSERDVQLERAQIIAKDVEAQASLQRKKRGDAGRLPGEFVFVDVANRKQGDLLIVPPGCHAVRFYFD